MAKFSFNNVGHNIFGTRFTEPITAREALIECGADFEVKKQPLLVANQALADMLNGNMALGVEGTEIINGNQYVSIDMLKSLVTKEYNATMRMDTEQPLGIVSDTYGVVQNQDAFNYMDMLTSGTLGTKIDITNAGSLLGGRRVYVQGKFPEPIRMGGNNNDIIDMFITVSTGHDGGASCQIAITPYRAACLNSLNYCLAHCASKITYRHSSNVGVRMDLTNKENAELAYKTLRLYETYKTFFEESLNELAKVKLTDKEMEEIIVKSVLPKDAINIYMLNGKNIYSEDISTKGRNLVLNILEANESGIGQDIITEKNSGLSLVNALTTYYQNNKNWSDNEKKYLSITEGDAQMKLQRLFNNLSAIKVA